MEIFKFMLPTSLLWEFAFLVLVMNYCGDDLFRNVNQILKQTSLARVFQEGNDQYNDRFRNVT